MNFENYAQQMLKKYQLAVSIAAIKNKPENLTIDQYVEQLRERAARAHSFDDPTLVLSDDFYLNDDDFNIDDKDDSLPINEFNTAFDTKEPIIETNAHRNIKTKDNELANCITSESIDLLQNYATPATIGNTNNNEEEMKDIEITILSNVAVDDDSLEDVLRTLKSIDHSEIQPQTNYNMHSQEISQMMSCDSIFQSNKHYDILYNKCLNNNIDFINLEPENNTQVVVDERIRAKVEKNVNKRMKLAKKDSAEDKNLSNGIDFEGTILKNTYEMEVDVALQEIRECKDKQYYLKADSIEDNIVTEKNTIRVNNPKMFNKAKEENSKTTDCLKNTYEREVDIAIQEIRETKHRLNDLNSEKENIPVIKNKVSNQITQLENENNESYNSNNYLTNSNENQHIQPKNALGCSTQDTILYTLPDFTQHASYISQSQFQNIQIPQMFIHGNNNITQNIINQENNETRIFNINKTNNQHNFANSKIVTIDSNAIQYITDQSGNTYAVLNSIQLDNAKEISKTDQNEISDTSQQETNIENSKKLHLEVNNEAEELLFSDNEDSENEELDKELSPEEVVPFKVVKELSKVKAYLSRELANSHDGSSDSGYRSDSQASYKTARRSDEWLSEAGHCLFEHLSQCALVAAATHIREEIAQALGGLVDRLHGSGRAPPFVERLLASVRALLAALAGGGGDQLLDKDETIQRLLLLNKSPHVIKYSLENIVQMLEKIHLQFAAKESLFELTDITQVENSIHIFYILEMFIPMYNKAKNITSQQSTQSSQESKLIKKSSLTEIWKRKWQPNTSEVKNAGNDDKSCVLTRCGEILNKVVVDCMDGYSLVSFAALQCFNMLQS